MKERIYRDSVHNIIRLETESPEGRLLESLIDTAEFQRLRRIRQLGLAHFAYQGAEHSRFTHSLGVFHLTTRILYKLSSKYEISDEDKTAVRVAALLHDIGHGAFSHVIEGIQDFHHEEFSIEAVLSNETEVGKLLKDYSAKLPGKVADIIRGNFRPMALAQLVSSQLDADRMDYLLRDSLMTGAKYGIYDLEWVIKSIEIDEQNDRLYVSARGIYAVEDYLQARYYMFRQVYFHRTLRSAEAILGSLFRRALTLFKTKTEVIWHAKGTAFEKILGGGKLTLSEHLEIDDSDIIFHIKQWQSSSDKILADLSKRFLNRQLLKVFDIDMPEDERNHFLFRAKEVVENAGYDTDYYFVEDKASDVPYYFYTTDVDPKNLIYVEEGFSNPQIREISEVSAAVRGLQKSYQIHRLCFPPELKEEITTLYHQDNRKTERKAV
ncbi:MAG: HD domain-containing protein [Pyrinomonadaceae bacterium]|nr:HD domain-containing protein [Pyrinomonadaceae bacterium]